jgi:hypothetical protein
VIGIIRSLNTVNVRQGPAASFPAFVALDPGTGVQVLGPDADGAWFNIQLEDGREGWVSATLVRIEPSLTPFPSATMTPNLTALAEGSPLPTALIGGGSVTPTPELRGVTATSAALDPAALGNLTGSPAASTSLPVVNLSSINGTSTALANLLGTPRPTQSGSTDIAPVPVASGTADSIPTSSAPIIAPTTSGEPIVQNRTLVLAICDDAQQRLPAPTNLGAGSTLQLYYRWFARTETQVQQHLDNAIYSVRINDQAVSSQRFVFTPIQLRDDGNHTSDWFTVIGPLDAGTYQVEFSLSWTQQIFDGYEYYGPGSRLPNVTQTGTCTFVVR